jgi:hypothetical protein
VHAADFHVIHVDISRRAAMKAVGDSGSIEVTEQAVMIRRRKILGSNDDMRAVKLSDLSGIEFRRPSAFEGGYIKLIIGGGGPSSDLSNKSHDRNTVTFSIIHEADFAKVRAHLMQVITGEPFKEEPDSNIQSQIAAIMIGGIVLMFATWFLSAMLNS